MSAPVPPATRGRSAAPWLFGLAAVLTVLAPFLFAIVWVVDGTAAGWVPAVIAALVDLFAAVLAALAGTAVAARRGYVRVRTAVTGHPQGRAGRLAEHHAARWHLARDRFAVLRSEWAAFEADRGAVARRPALTDVAVPATADFVEAYRDAEFLLTDAEPAGPRRAEFIAAVDRAVAAWTHAQQVADEHGAPGSHGVPASRAMAGEDHAEAPTGPVGPSAAREVPPGPARQSPGHEPPGQEYAQVADAVRKAARRGVDDLKNRLRA